MGVDETSSDGLQWRQDNQCGSDSVGLSYSMNDRRKGHELGQRSDKLGNTIRESMSMIVTWI